MSAETLFNLDFQHWKALLLSSIPALVTLGSIIYFLHFPLYKINKVYVLYLLGIFAWQLDDSLCRMSLSEETARSWDRLLAIIWSLQFPSTIHFIILLGARRRWNRNFWLWVLLYLPTFVIGLMLCSGLFRQPFTYSSFWGWMRTYDDFSSYVSMAAIWVCAEILFNIYLIADLVYRNRNSAEEKSASILIFFAYSIPAVTGVATQVIFPLFLKLDPIPIASTLMVTIVLVIYAFSAYKAFSLSETLDTERIAEIIQETIFVVSPQRTLTYINSHGIDITNLAVKEVRTVRDLFLHSGHAYHDFEEQVLIPSFEKKHPASFQFSMEDKNGKSLHWDINAYPIITGKTLQGLLFICRDRTDRMLLAEARLAALRSQMNPHFIFNALNAVQNYIHSYQREAAEDFLSTFSQLIRRILDHSTKALIPLADELHTIELYLRLEKARFGERLTYEITSEAGLDMENILVPSMLIQPYIENAILHGLSSKKEGGTVVISLKKMENFVQCSIKDNGIGRKQALEIKNRKSQKNMSYGMHITKIRLDLLNQHLPVPVSVNVVDLFDDQNRPCGTEVEVCMPAEERF